MREVRARMLPRPHVGYLYALDRHYASTSELFVFFTSADDLILVSVSVFDGAQQPQFLKLQDKPPNGGIGRIAKILFQLLGGKFSNAVSGENEVPKGRLLLGDPALGKGIIEGSSSGRHRQGVIQFVVHILNEVHQKRRHIQNTADLSIILHQRVGIIISLPALIHIFRERNKQRRGVALLHQIPQVQQPRHSSIAVKIRVQIGDIEVDQGSLEQIVHRCLILYEADEIAHVVF